MPLYHTVIKSCMMASLEGRVTWAVKVVLILSSSLILLRGQYLQINGYDG